MSYQVINKFHILHFIFTEQTTPKKLKLYKIIRLVLQFNIYELQQNI